MDEFCEKLTEHQLGGVKNYNNSARRDSSSSELKSPLSVMGVAKMASSGEESSAVCRRKVNFV